MVYYYILLLTHFNIIWYYIIFTNSFYICSYYQLDWIRLSSGGFGPWGPNLLKAHPICLRFPWSNTPEHFLWGAQRPVISNNSPIILIELVIILRLSNITKSNNFSWTKVRVKKSLKLSWSNFFLDFELFSLLVIFLKKIIFFLDFL